MLDNDLFFANPPFEPREVAKQLIEQLIVIIRDKAIEDKVVLVLPVYHMRDDLVSIKSYPVGSKLFSNEKNVGVRTKWITHVAMVTKEAKEDKEVSRVHVLANAATPLYGQLQKKAVLDLAQLREMLVDIHDGMHLSNGKTKELVERYISNVGDFDLNKEIKSVRDKCGVCTMAKKQHVRVYKPVPVEHLYQCVSMDWIKMEATSKRGKNRILTITEKLSKFLVAIPCHTKDTTEDMIDQYMKFAYPIFGIPEVWISDQDVRWLLVV
jgi:hypothetical protein